MDNKEKSFFLGRQPILDRNNKVYAYEFLFRSSTDNQATFESNEIATSSVIHYAFSELGLEKTLGKSIGFINIEEKMLTDDILKLLPKQQVGIELLGPFLDSEKTLETIKNLKSEGFILSWDDFTTMDEIRDFLPYLDIIKIDFARFSQTELINILKEIKSTGKIKVAAKKVENRFFANSLHAIGFDLFQGYFFAEPEIIHGRRINPSEHVIMKLMGLFRKDADVKQIEVVFKESPDLSVNLLRLVNSAALRTANPIQSISQAITMLGRKQMQRWLQILLFNSDRSKDPKANPLLQLAATRGALMEEMAKFAGGNDDDQATGFMTGILSLLDALMGMSMNEVVKKFSLDEVVVEALLERKGTLGDFLVLVERMEADLDITDILEVIHEDFPMLNDDILTDMQIKAITWANEISVS